MANTVKVKRSNVAGKVPTTSEIAGGELGVNMVDKKVFINNGTTIEQVGSGTLAGLVDVAVTNPSNNDYLVYDGTSWVNTDRLNAKTIFEVVKNVSGASLAKGTPVYQIGTAGNSITVGPARADNPTKLAIGVLDENTADQAEGRMLVLGEIKGVDTSTFTTGDKIYLGASGGYTNVPPTTAAHQFLGVVFRVDANSGSGYITGTLLPDAVRWTGTALEAWTGTAWVAVGGGGGEVTLDGVQTLTNKTLEIPVLNMQASSLLAGSIGYAIGLLTYGDGTYLHEIVNTDSEQTLSGKTLTLPTLQSPRIATAGTNGVAGRLGFFGSDFRYGDGVLERIVVNTDSSQTLSNKRISPRLSSQSSSSTITPSADNQDQLNITALAVSATIATPTGTPVDGQKLMLRIEDNGTPRALSWSSSYRPIGVTLPTTTTALKTMYIGMIYNSQDSFWDVIAVAIQA